jgi:hypothetical protein
MACPQCCPEGPPRLATPQAPLTWEERPRRLRGVPGQHPRKQQKSLSCPLPAGLMRRKPHQKLERSTDSSDTPSADKLACLRSFGR